MSSHATEKEIRIGLFRSMPDQLIRCGKLAEELNRTHDKDWQLLKTARLEPEDKLWLEEMGINTRGFLHFTVIQVGGVR